MTDIQVLGNGTAATMALYLDNFFYRLPSSRHSLLSNPAKYDPIRDIPNWKKSAIRFNLRLLVIDSSSLVWPFRRVALSLLVRPIFIF